MHLNSLEITKQNKFRLDSGKNYLLFKIINSLGEYGWIVTITLNSSRVNMFKRIKLISLL